MNKIEIPSKPRKHKWITETLKGNCTQLSMWPSDDDLSSEAKKVKFLETVAKVGNDPRVSKITKHDHPTYGSVFVFHIETK